MSESTYCPKQGKVRYISLAAAGVGARMFAQAKHRRREIVETLYAYQCERCGQWHLTRTAVYFGVRHEMVYEAADPEIQRWGWRSR